MTSPSPAHAAAILLAAGRSTRMSAQASPHAGEAELARKPFLVLHGRTVLARAVAAFDAAPCVSEIVLVAHAQDVARLRELAARGELGRKLVDVVEGGEERTDSVRAGAAALARRARETHTRAPDVVLVHDVARPLVRSERIEAVALAARASGAALLAVPVRDTIKRSRDGRAAESTLDRRELWAARTPQAFAAERLHAMLERAAAEGLRATDDAALHERYFGPVALVEDAPDNWKLTTRDDLALAEAWLAREETHG